ncbi:MAG: hypothetical protein ACREV5_01290 [Steroidobacter sp.]
MNNVPQTSPTRLLASAGVALLCAVLILLVIVLPAEYGRDPTGFGRVLGLTALGDAKRIAENTRPGAPMHAHPRQHRTARVVINLEGREELEYKAVLAQGEPMLYSWRVAGGPVYFEFHGDPTEGEWPEDFFLSYQIKDSSLAEHGSFVAPFTGRHGWYWRNLSDDPAAITLEVSGYYTRVGRIR